jgi:hypothetical protein
MLATDRIDGNGNNPYWQNTASALVAAALTLLVSRRTRTSFSEAVEFMRSWFVQIEGSAVPKGVTEVLEGARRKATQPGASLQLLGALDHVSVWKHLDSRTRSNLQSCLLNILRPLMSAEATSCFGANDRPVFDPAQVATQGKLCVVSVNALTHPDLARFFMRLARRQFFDAVQARASTAKEHRLCGLVADEFPLIVQPEDADQLATLRSKRCFVMAATQGLSGLDDKIGARVRRSILLNFNSLFFLRTREQEAGELATLSMGTRGPSESQKEWEDTMVALMVLPSSSDRQLPVCLPGALGRLQPHQGYVIKSDGTRTINPVWFVPWFEMPRCEQHNPTSGRAAKSSFGADHIEGLMERSGIEPVLSPEVLHAALTIDARILQCALDKAREFFRSKGCIIPEGLEFLPAAWLAGLPGILQTKRKRHRTKAPYMVQRVACVDGVLLLDFAQEDRRRSSRLTAWDRIRVLVNRCLYPSRWRPLLRRHRLQIGVSHPELRAQLQTAELNFS